MPLKYSFLPFLQPPDRLVATFLHLLSSLHGIQWLTIINNDRQVWWTLDMVMAMMWTTWLGLRINFIFGLYLWMYPWFLEVIHLFSWYQSWIHLDMESSVHIIVNPHLTLRLTLNLNCASDRGFHLLFMIISSDHRTLFSYITTVEWLLLVFLTFCYFSDSPYFGML